MSVDIRFKLYDFINEAQDIYRFWRQWRGIDNNGRCLFCNGQVAEIAVIPQAEVQDFPHRHRLDCELMRLRKFLETFEK